MTTTTATATTTGDCIAEMTTFQLTGLLPASDTMAQATAKHLLELMTKSQAEKCALSSQKALFPKSAHMFPRAFADSLHECVNAKNENEIGRARAALLALHEAVLRAHGV